MSKAVKVGLISVMFFSATANSGEVNNGADGFEVGDGFKFFDQVECKTPFYPADPNTDEPVKKAYQKIKAQLEVLTAKMPSTGQFLSSFFVNGSAIWCFVDVPFKEIDDEGESNIAVTWKKVQVAINQKDVIKIRRDIWDTMDETAQAMVFTHEVLWSALRDGVLVNGEQIRNLNNLFMNPTLSQFFPVNIVKFISQFLGEKNLYADLYTLAQYDLKAFDGLDDFKVEHYFGERSNDVFLRYIGQQGKIKDLLVTTLNPNPRYMNIMVNRNHGVFVDLTQSEDVVGEEKVTEPNFSEVEISKLCERMRFAGQVGWRLPTEGEIYSLFDEDIQQVFYTRRSAKFRTYGPNGFVDTSLSTEYFFPSTYPLRVLGSSFSILDVKNGFKNIVTSYPVRLGVPFVEEIAGPKYFCVKTTSP